MKKFFWLRDNSICIDVIKPHTREKMKRNKNIMKIEKKKKSECQDTILVLSDPLVSDKCMYCTENI